MTPARARTAGGGPRSRVFRVSFCIAANPECITLRKKPWAMAGSLLACVLLQPARIGHIGQHETAPCALFSQYSGSELHRMQGLGRRIVTGPVQLTNMNNTIYFL